MHHSNKLYGYHECTRHYSCCRTVWKQNEVRSFCLVHSAATKEGASTVPVQAATITVFRLSLFRSSWKEAAGLWFEGQPFLLHAVLRFTWREDCYGDAGNVDGDGDIVKKVR